jgi:superfamily II DNA or RNA helicase
LIAAVEPFDSSAEGRIHLVSIEYLDADGQPEETLIWEREPRARILEATALPDPIRDAPMSPDEFDALVNATRWTALSPFVDPDEEGPLDRLPVSAPFHGAIQVEDFQLVPLLKALRMPRISLLLADDVGLGKTIEAGLILTELLQRRRIRRVLILCPASLRSQWKQEMHDKFSLSFDIVDRPATHALQKRLGMDANPWRSFPRIIASFDYLKQADVLEQFRSACRIPEGSPHLPWEMLIVDEAHNLAPSTFGEDSDLARMLRLIAPWFEHKLFLTATPHNGHTRSFTGLLECLDPVRFSRKSEPLTENEKERIKQVVVRRLKSEINARTNPPRFCSRDPVSLPLALSPEELALSAAFQEFRTKVRQLVASARRSEQLAGAFAVEVLGKRLLSCPATFADSWQRYKQGMRSDEAARVEEVRAAEKAAREDTGDDREAESRVSHAVATIGAWLKPLAERLATEIERIDAALDALGLNHPDVPANQLRPLKDARFDALQKLINRQLCQNGRFRGDERLVVFTEYKTTLDYLTTRLQELYTESGVVRDLYGDLHGPDRDEIIAAFNDPSDPVRILVATDTASEGLNLQETARYLLHYDVPWNPARLEQRNGRLDRHGQARDVVVHHFTTDDDADLAFLAYVVNKVHTIREDLGSTGEVFDAAVERRLISGEPTAKVKEDLENQLETVKGRASIPCEETKDTGAEGLARLQALAFEVDLSPETLRQTLDVALGLGFGRPRIDGPDNRQRFRLIHPVPPRWISLVDDELRLGSAGNQGGAIPSLIFDPKQFVRMIGTLPVFRPERDTALLHLGHPIFHHALATFARTRFPGGDGSSNATRWTVRPGPVPDVADALLLLTVEEFAVNELRETFHHWVRTIRFPIIDGELKTQMAHLPACELRVPSKMPEPPDIEKARTIWDEVATEVRQRINELAESLNEKLADALVQEGTEALARENERFQSRQGEVSALIEQTTLQRLEREITSLRNEATQGVLFDREDRLAELERSIAEKEEEVRRRRAHYEELREQLAKERDRVTRFLLPKRYALRGEAQIFPVAVEIRFPLAEETTRK